MGSIRVEVHSVHSQNYTFVSVIPLDGRSTGEAEATDTTSQQAPWYFVSNSQGDSLLHLLYPGASPNNDEAFQESSVIQSTYKSVVW